MMKWKYLQGDKFYHAGAKYFSFFIYDLDNRFSAIMGSGAFTKREEFSNLLDAKKWCLTEARKMIVMSLEEIDEGLNELSAAEVARGNE